MSDTWTDIHIHTLPDGRVSVLTETNDNADRGYPADVESWTLEYPSIEALPFSHRYSHLGLYGQPVRVWLDGIEQLTRPQPRA